MRADLRQGGDHAAEGEGLQGSVPRLEGRGQGRRPEGRHLPEGFPHLLQGVVGRAQEAEHGSQVGQGARGDRRAPLERQGLQPPPRDVLLRRRPGDPLGRQAPLRQGAQPRAPGARARQDQQGCGEAQEGRRGRGEGDHQDTAAADSDPEEMSRGADARDLLDSPPA